MCLLHGSLWETTGVISLTGGPIKATARLLGFPEGAGELVPRDVRIRLIISLIGSVMLSGLELLGLLSMIPLMQYVAGMSTEEGVLGTINNLLGHPGPTVLVITISGAMASCFALKDVTAFYFRRWQLRFMASNQVDITVTMLEQYLTGPYALHLSKNTGDKLWTMSGAVGMGYSTALSAALAIITDTLSIAVIFVSLLVISPWVTLAAAAYLGSAALIVQRVIRPRILAAGLKSVSAGQEASKASLQALTSVKEIKLRRAQRIFVDRYRVASREAVDASISAAVLGGLPNYFLEVVFIVGVAVLAVVTTTGASPGESLVLLGIFVAAGTRILPTSNRLIASIASIRFAYEPLRHLLREHRYLLAAQNAEESWRTTDDIPIGDIRAEDIHFAYPDEPNTPVLRGVSVTIPSGKSVALVGSSGAGKSTLVDILLGLHRPGSGTVTAGGIDIFSNLPAWQARVAVVPQDVTLLDDTFRVNVAFDEDVDELRLRQAIDLAQLTDIVDALPQGVDNAIGERGVRLSGGQRQRIGIARALYRRPMVLFLDEATSALDNETEHRLTDTIEALQGSMTIVIVAHRLSTVRHCDHLLFMEDGTVRAFGTFDEVARTNASFARLVELGSLQSPSPGTPGSTATRETGD